VIDGLGIFARRSDGSMPFSLSLVGFGSADERGRLEEAIRRNQLESVVEVHPRIDNDEVPELVSRFNVGVAFTPREPWYEHQPSTKIYEYFQSGLLCIATDSEANRRVVDPANGVLVDGTPEGFCRGLEEVVEMLPRWRPDDVVATVERWSWERIVNTRLVPILDDVLGAG
jgi:glycosyltransferase involved in cell wall biosynthesis